MKTSFSKKIVLGSLVALSAAVMTSCGSSVVAPRGYVKIKQETALKNPTHEDLRKFITDPKNKNAAVVVRDRTEHSGDLTSGGNTRMCALLERGLLEQGYNPRDRKLFQALVEKMDKVNDYKAIYDKTGVDLIFEVSQFSIDPYNIDRYFEKQSSKAARAFAVTTSVPSGVFGQSALTTYQSFVFYGFTIEIKVILVRDNLVGGIYKYCYTPCTSENGGCYFQNWDPVLRTIYYTPNDPFMVKDPDKLESSKVESTNEINDNLLSQFFSNIVMPFMFDEMKGK